MSTGLYRLWRRLQPELFEEGAHPIQRSLCRNRFRRVMIFPASSTSDVFIECRGAFAILVSIESISREGKGITFDQEAIPRVKAAIDHVDGQPDAGSENQ
jgi:hypothetical protein